MSSSDRDRVAVVVFAVLALVFFVTGMTLMGAIFALLTVAYAGWVFTRTR